MGEMLFDVVVKMGLSRQVMLAISALLAGCGSSEAGEARPAPGTERGQCYPNGTCNAGLSCASNFCVKLGGTAGAAETGGAAVGSGAAGSGGVVQSAGGGNGGSLPGNGGVPGMGGSPTPTIYCATDSTSCTCGHNADYGPSVPCSTTTVGSGVCCASPGWPATGLCYCERPACEQYSATLCTCSGASPGATTLAACTGPVCCRSRSTAFQERCDCWTDRHDNCALSGETQVASCSVADVKCQPDAVAVSACN